VLGQLPRLADLGFDVLYLPPIHPIGRTHRKGRNNTLVALPDDVGSPWAIGAAEGGHTAIHPDLGTEADFDRLVTEAARHGLEIALDYALQCSPDHPWVNAHPTWFTQLPDGSIRYAENPPKKYQDIYPINFWPEDDDDRRALWQECKAILDHWITRGVRIFRVDNPHTKPLAFWAWVIEQVRRAHPDVIFLAEAFTTPDMMAKLAEIGFTQSYTYFTWRYSRSELTSYLTELASPPLVDTMRPNFWPNTPDILEGMLRDGPLSSFALRFVLAATLVPNYGIYSGYELGENRPASPDNTEYLDSEKYQLLDRDYARQPNLSELISRVNRSRRLHPALAQLATLRFWDTDNEAIIAYSKTAPRADGDDVVLVVVNLDPDRVQAATLSLDLAALGLPPDEQIDAHDELIDITFPWQGPHPWVRLDPAHQPAHVLHLRRRT
jgi:starch synthase (maltosyl-transferring)